MTRTVILVPRREGFAYRDKVWEWTRAWWESEFPELPIIEGHHDVGLFNRAAALNAAAKQAGRWDLALVIDADVFCLPEHVREALSMAVELQRVVVPFRVRHNLSRVGSDRIMSGYLGNWRPLVAQDWLDQHSSVIVVPRSVWDTVGGFDETFAGWGMEDTAFAISVATLVGDLVHMEGELWHLWHPSAPEGHRGTPSANANRARGARYQAALGDADAIRALLAEQHRAPSSRRSAMPRRANSPDVRKVSEQHPAPADAAMAMAVDETGIPRLFHRVVPEVTSDDVEQWWAALQELHPHWRFMTHRDPLDPNDWPETAAQWRFCRNGASLADLVRLEALWKWGGIYLDSDVQPFRSFEALQPLSAFAAWEDSRTVPNAVLGARREHPAIRACLNLALREVRKGTWPAGPGVTTKILPGRDDVLLLPPGSFYPVHYRDPARDRKMDQLTAADAPWAFALHHYAGSWLEQPHVKAEAVA